MAARRRRLGALVALLAFAQAGCAAGRDQPATLVDGTPVQGPPVELEGVESRQIATRATPLRPVEALSASVRRCLTATSEHTPRAPLVLRTGVAATSVSYQTASGRALVACDGTAPGRRWCGFVLGRLHEGRLLDPRLDLAGCATASGARLAFAWVDTDPRTRYVAVRQERFAEVYSVLARLPVRVTTSTGVDLDTSSASFEVSEHDAGGRVVRSYTLRTRVAG